MTGSPPSDDSTTPPTSRDEPPSKRRKLDDGSRQLDYRNGVFLAPMVRIGTLPTRLLALEYGASLVWGPEVVDRAMMDAERIVEPSGVIRFMNKTQHVFETHPIEKDRLIYQIGSAHPEQALAAAKKVEDLVAGVDLNCGCPKSFSIHGGMGAELLKVPDKLVAILQSLIGGLSVPVSCKIRLLPNQAATLNLARRIAETGVSCLTVHCRTQEMRPREPALLDRLRDIVDVVTPYGIPVVANGDCFMYRDIDRIRKLTGVTSLMIARGAESNVSVFRAEGPLDPVDDVIPRYLSVSCAVSHPWANAKYTLLAGDLNVSPVRRNKKERNAVKAKLGQAKTLDDACKGFGVDSTVRPELEALLPNLVKRNTRSQLDEARRPFSIPAAALPACRKDGDSTLPTDKPV